MPRKAKKRKKHAIKTKEKDFYELGEVHRCSRCGDKFKTKVDLELHINDVHKRKPALNEIRLLEKGFLPEESKLGMPFKGKNKIVIA